ncbi:crossover junction endodeoxyribonuclease RuvC, partial [Candidatus Falkowbacteria bacterium]|nr:crossover junction endodeoxyribonuclease RuvC [Candidatus Falkowbacteria bacterium]
MQTTGGKVVLGIDPGIADTGVGVVRVGKNGRLECLYYASIKTSSKEALADRLIQLHDQIEVVIKKYKPDVSAIEQLFFCKNVKTALVVGQARGVALYTLKKSRLSIAEFT